MCDPSQGEDAEPEKDVLDPARPGGTIGLRKGSLPLPIEKLPVKNSKNSRVPMLSEFGERYEPSLLTNTNKMSGS